MRRNFTIALTGNPNSGKTSLFNALTGLNQKVGNFPGVTVDKKLGTTILASGQSATVIDLPGTYSLYPRSMDEVVACSVLLDRENTSYPDLIVIVADASNLKRNLLFCSQILDLRIPAVIALTMNDIALKKGVRIDVEELERQMGVPVVFVNPRKNQGLDILKKRIASIQQLPSVNTPGDFIDFDTLAGGVISEIQELCDTSSAYHALQLACGYEEADYISADTKKKIKAILEKHNFSKAKVQATEIMERYQRINTLMRAAVVEASPISGKLRTEKADKILLHPVWGNLILLATLFLIFQGIFWLAAYPMDWIDGGMSALNGWLNDLLPESTFKDLLLNGILAGIGGIVIFIPQIMILFGCITLLEDSGYMARISFLTDRIMRSVGLNGKSVMPLISGFACAVPAVMAARTIQNRKERLITIMITPLMSCSARLPVYTILTSLVVPDRNIGIFNLKGIVMMGLYVLGFLMAMVVAWIMNKVVALKEKSIFLMELPVYRMPRWKNVGITMLEKAKIFVFHAGKVIFMISLVLWFLASYGPPGKMDEVNAYYTEKMKQEPDRQQVIADSWQTARLEQSFAGILGKSIEPAIKPLGYDWKIGIAIITSFAAREVFVGTMATLYSVGGDDEHMERTLREKMEQARTTDGRPVYTLATGISLLIFYAFAMQCMSTMAIVRRELGHWKYAIIQFAYMLVLAYGGAWIAYQLLTSWQ